MEVTLWVILLIVCVIAEAATSISLVTIWFIPGAVVALILAAMNAPTMAQIAAFLILSLISLYITRVFARKRHNSRSLEKTNADALIGKTALLLEDCSSEKNSSIKIGDIVWTAKSENGDALAKDTIVTIVKIEGNTLIVKQ